MLSSMVVACVLAGLLSPVGTSGQPQAVPLAGPGPTARLSAQGCATDPAPATIIADLPWPQQRYDLAAVSQITDGSGVIVAVVDSGINAGHPQLRAAALAGADMLEGAGDARSDCVGHGTAVASIIAARPTPGTSMRGLAPGVAILPIRVSERLEADGIIDGDGSVADLAAGIRAATISRPKPSVINLSIAAATDDAGLRAAVQAALDADIVVVAAVGNRHEQGDPVPYPASYDGVVGVGAIAPDGHRVASSQVGPYVDVVAPGDAVVAAAGTHGQALYQGTSFATPFVAATAALIRARWPALSRFDVVRRLLATADPAPGSRLEYGYGVVNPLRALTELMPGEPAGTASGAVAVGPPRARGDDHEPGIPAIGAAAMLLALAAAGAIVAAILPLGRRRRWRPGQHAPKASGGTP